VSDTAIRQLKRTVDCPVCAESVFLKPRERESTGEAYRRLSSLRLNLFPNLRERESARRAHRRLSSLRLNLFPNLRERESAADRTVYARPALQA